MKLKDLPKKLRFLTSYIRLGNKNFCAYIFQSSHKKFYEILIDEGMIDVERVYSPSLWSKTIRVDDITFFIVDKSVFLKLMKPFYLQEIGTDTIQYYQSIKGKHKSEINKVDKNVNLPNIQKCSWGKYHLKNGFYYDKGYILEILGIERNKI